MSTLLGREPKNLPTQLGDLLVDAQAGFATGIRDPKGVIQLRMNNVTTRGTFDWSSITRVPPPSGNDLQLAPGDVVFNNTNSAELVGKSAHFRGIGETVYFSNHFTRLRTNPERLMPAYLAFWLQAKWQSGHFSRICNRWVGQAAVQREKLLALELEVPPLPQQDHVVTALTGQLAAVEHARAAAEARLEAARSLPASQLRALFSSADWPARPLGEVCQLLPSRSVSTAGSTSVRVVTTACLKETGFDPSGVKTARMMEGDALESRLVPGEVLVARSNTPELVGRVAAYHGEPSDVVASDLTIRLMPRQDVMSDFLAAYLSYLYLTGYWKERAGGASGSMKKITRTQLLEESVPVPSLAEQGEVICRLDDRIRQCRSILDGAGEGLAALNSLPTALLRQAFPREL